jgi:hypothetical protein
MEPLSLKSDKIGFYPRGSLHFDLIEIKQAMIGISNSRAIVFKERVI